MPLVERALRRITLRPRTLVHRYNSPPHTSTSSQSCRRAFHASPRRLIIDECLSATHMIITGIHSTTGLSWAATIPLTAVLIRLTVIGPITAYGQKILRRRVELFPLFHAWNKAIARNVYKAHGPEGPVACEKIIVKAVRDKGKEVRRNMGVQYWKSSLSLIQLPVFLVVIDTIRSICGYSHGLLRMIRSGIMGRSTATEDPVPDELGETVSQTMTGPYYEPSLAAEGVLWFPDLLIPDPCLILPFALSASLFATIYTHERKAKIVGLPDGKWQGRFQRTMKVLALCIGPATLGVPSGMLLYWISSTWCTLGQNALIDWYIPTKPAVKPCEPKKPKTPSIAIESK